MLRSSQYTSNYSEITLVHLFVDIIAEKTYFIGVVGSRLYVYFPSSAYLSISLLWLYLYNSSTYFSCARPFLFSSIHKTENRIVPKSPQLIKDRRSINPRNGFCVHNIYSENQLMMILMANLNFFFWSRPPKDYPISFMDC